MKLKTFFEKFELFADAPGAVGKMRELLLQLAVRGELVPQNPHDEPAAKAIEKIVSVNGSGRNAKLFEEEKSIDLPFTVPALWNWVRFGNLVRIRTGKLDANAAVVGGEYPFFTCSKTPSRISTYSFDTSAVILAGNGDFNLKSYSGKFDAYQRTYVIEPLGWELGFCFWLVSAQIKRITENQRGSAIPYLRLGDIADPLVPFPPLAEQKRIAAKVDELMALCDQLEAQQQERMTRHADLTRAALARFADAPTPANLNFLFHPSYTIAPADLRKTILSLAVQGKLVPQKPDDEPAIQSKDSTIEFNFPPNWYYGNVFDLALLKSGNSFPYEKELGEGEYLYVKVSDMNLPENSYEITTSSRFVVPERSDLKGLIPANSIVFPKRGGAIATNKKRLVRKPIFVDSNTMAIICPPFIELRYLHIWFLGIDLWELNSGTSVPQINNKDIGPLVIPLPPLAEQRRIVAKVDQLMALVDELEARLAASRAISQNLLSALVTEIIGTTNSRNVSASPVKSAAPAPRPADQPIPAAPIASASPPSVPATPASSTAPKSLRTLAEQRKAVGLSQSAVAKAMGLNQAYISQMETGKRAITDEQRQQLAEVLRVTSNMICV